MMKKMVVSGLAAIVIGASGVGAYEVVQSGGLSNKSPQTETSANGNGPAGSRDTNVGEANGSGQGYRGGQNGEGSRGQGQGSQGQGQGSQSQGQDSQGQGQGSQGRGQNSRGSQDEAARGGTGTNDATGQGGQQGYRGGQNGTEPRGQADGGRETQPQTQVDEWLTLTGTITGVEQTRLTLTTGDDQTVTLEMGPAWFWNSQGVVFEIGDTVDVLGYEADEGYGPVFHTASVTRTSDGASIQLRDSESGQPLWGSRGRAGQ